MQTHRDERTFARLLDGYTARFDAFIAAEDTLAVVKLDGAFAAMRAAQRSGWPELSGAMSALGVAACDAINTMESELAGEVQLAAALAMHARALDVLRDRVVFAVA
jgi:hypothetical protein